MYISDDFKGEAGGHRDNKKRLNNETEEDTEKEYWIP
jgi:hypothetical protein